MDFENKNDKQLYFNHTKGVLIEVFKGDAFCHLTIEAGHEKSDLSTLLSVLINTTLLLTLPKLAKKYV